MPIEHKFDSLDIATQELSRLGFSLDGPFFKEKIYHVVPSKITDDHPTMRNSRTPRFVAFVNSKGTLTFDKPFDENSILMRYYEILRALTTKAAG